MDFHDGIVDDNDEIEGGSGGVGRAPELEFAELGGVVDCGKAKASTHRETERNIAVELT